MRKATTRAFDLCMIVWVDFSQILAPKPVAGVSGSTVLCKFFVSRKIGDMYVSQWHVGDCDISIIVSYEHFRHPLRLARIDSCRLMINMIFLSEILAWHCEVLKLALDEIFAQNLKFMVIFSPKASVKILFRWARISNELIPVQNCLLSELTSENLKIWHHIFVHPLLGLYVSPRHIFWHDTHESLTNGVDMYATY